MSVLIAVALMCGGGAQAWNTVSGSLWHVPEAVVSSPTGATPGNVPLRQADVTFSVNSPFNFAATDGTVGAWLASSNAFSIVENTPGTLTSRMDNFTTGTIVDFQGFVSVTNGQTFTVEHDDGLTLLINGAPIINVPEPTSPRVTTVTYTGPTGDFPFELVYSECTGGPAVLRIDLPFTSGENTDLSGDGHPDLVWQHQTTGDIAAWMMNGTAAISMTLLTPNKVADTNWKIVGVADLNGDGHADLVWQHQTTGDIAAWMMNGTAAISMTLLTPSQVADTNWKIVGVADLNGDGHADLVWQHQTTGDIAAWMMNGTAAISMTLLTPSQVADTNWKIVGVADLNGDGHADLVWQHQTTGDIAAWMMNGTAAISMTLLTPSQVADTNWKIVGVADLNGDGPPDLVWQHQTTGDIAAWMMNGTAAISMTLLTPGQVADTNWKIVGVK